MSLGRTLFIALWITGRGVSESSHLGSPGDQSMCVVLTCRKVETDWTLLRSACKNCAECWMMLQEESHKDKDLETEFRSREETLP